jgi:hypothetical protein
MLKRRSRIVSFRLSAEEYDSLRNLSASNGARSVSEFTRSVACQTIPEGATGAAKLDNALVRLNEVVDELHRRIERLSEILTTPEKKGE